MNNQVAAVIEPSWKRSNWPGEVDRKSLRLHRRRAVHCIGLAKNVQKISRLDAASV
jgi:hypothetical protein